MELIYNSEKIIAEISKSENGYRLSAMNGNLDFDIQVLSAGIYSLMVGNKSLKAYIAGNGDTLFVHIDGETFEFGLPKDDSDLRAGADSATSADDYLILPPMPSKVVKILVERGQKVAVGTNLVILESMKMENLIKSKVDAIVEAVNFSAGDLVDTGQGIIQMIPPTKSATS